jgi:Domain of unknown function (DUF1893)
MDNSITYFTYRRARQETYMLSPDNRLIVEKDGDQIFVGRRAHGVCGVVMAMAAHGADMNGSKLSCPFIGRPGARLILIAGVDTVFTQTITREALTLLRAGGTTVTYEEIIVPDQKERSTEIALQHISEKFVEPREFFEEMKGRLLKILEHNMFPTDDALLSNLQSRLGAGGGGT